MIVVFDAYGTLLDVHGAMRAHAGVLPPDWEAISAEWRQKQLEYAWVRSLTGPGQHRDFWTVTQDALDYVCARHRISDPATYRALLDSYRRLPAFPEAPGALHGVRARGWTAAVLSNGDPAMLENGVRSAGLRDLLDAVISAEAAGTFKPDPRVYALVTARFGCAPGDVAFVSANAWDTQGAAEAGFRCVRVNRSGAPDEYGLRGRTLEVADLAGLADRL